MRMIGRIQDSYKANEFSYFLQAEGIRHQLEKNGEDDHTLWVLDEDDIRHAEQWFEAFEQDPDNPMFYGHLKEARELQNAERQRLDKARSKEVHLKPTSRAYPPASTTPLTLLFVFLCVLLFSSAELSSSKSGIRQTIRKQLSFDYPERQEIVDQLKRDYSPELLQEPKRLPAEGKELYGQAVATSSWRGIYPWLASVRSEERPSLEAPLFEKIRQGQVWRLVSPAFLHGGLFHIFFNMMWLIVLGGQIESRIGALRYLLLVLIAAAFSNSAQYLMSGSNFLGMSGVVCGMATFVWVRQTTAPWEGYNLPQSTFFLISFFILIMFAIQVFSYSLEISGFAPLGPGIANTAHLSGALIGFFLAKLPFFEWQR